jgi:hypothetical protein
MLVTDTTHPKQRHIYGDVLPWVNQIKGYEVRTVERKTVSRSPGVYPINIVSIEDYHTHVAFLSETFSTLPKNTVVWMVKQIGGEPCR